MVKRKKIIYLLSARVILSLSLRECLILQRCEIRLRHLTSSEIENLPLLLRLRLCLNITSICLHFSAQWGYLRQCINKIPV